MASIKKVRSPKPIILENPEWNYTHLKGSLRNSKLYK
jgi:hypothetical protein